MGERQAAHRAGDADSAMRRAPGRIDEHLARGARVVDDGFASELAERTGAAVAFYGAGRRQATGMPNGVAREGRKSSVEPTGVGARASARVESAVAPSFRKPTR